MVKNTLFGGDWRKVLIKVGLLLLVLLLVYSVINKLIKYFEKKQDRDDKEDVLQEQINNPPVVTDDSTNQDLETITDNDALDIANKLEDAMTGWGTDEDAMFNLLQCLNGASLQKVKFEFGIRDYNGDIARPYDLFDWFGQEIETGALSTLVYANDCVPECTSWWSQCYEHFYMQEIWKKSGLPLTF